jgi:hypothetical protein
VADFLNWEFLRWILAFRRKHRPTLVALLRRHSGTTRVFVVRSPADADAVVCELATSRR